MQFGKATDWLTKPLQGPLKEFLGNTVLDLAMAAGGLIIRSVMTEVYECSGPFLAGFILFKNYLGSKTWVRCEYELRLSQHT